VIPALSFWALGTVHSTPPPQFHQCFLSCPTGQAKHFSLLVPFYLFSYYCIMNMLRNSSRRAPPSPEKASLLYLCPSHSDIWITIEETKS